MGAGSKDGGESHQTTTGLNAIPVHFLSSLSLALSVCLSPAPSPERALRENGERERAILLYDDTRYMGTEKGHHEIHYPYIWSSKWRPELNIANSNIKNKMINYFAVV